MKILYRLYNPKENTIWCNTSETITGWAFNSTEPVAYEGLVWFKTSTSSTTDFNAIVNNQILIYPISACQYISGKWVDMKVMSYQGEEWVEWCFLIYKNGVFHNGYDVTYVDSDNEKTGTITKESDRLSITASGATWYLFYFYPARSFADFKTVYISIENTSGTMDTGEGKIGLTKSVTAGDAEEPNFVSMVSFEKSDNATTYAIDVSSITATTAYYFAIRLGTTNTTFTFDVTEVWAE